MDYWDCTDSPDYENVQRIVNYLSGLPQVPGAALDALERLLALAYPGEITAYTCRICGDRISVPQTSGKRPKVLCKKVDCQRAANRQRVQQHRARRTQAQRPEEASDPHTE